MQCEPQYTFKSPCWHIKKVKRNRNNCNTVLFNTVYLEYYHFQHIINVKINDNLIFFLYLVLRNPVSYNIHHTTYNIQHISVETSCISDAQVASGYHTVWYSSRLWSPWELEPCLVFAAFLAGVGAHSFCAHKWMSEWTKDTGKVIM